MSKKTEVYFEEHGSDAMLPAEDMAGLLLGGEPEQPPVEPTDPPAEPTKEPEKLPVEPVEEPKEPEKLPEEPDPVILAKDGKHIIEYEKLVEARETAKGLKDDLGVSNDRIQKLEETIATLTAPKEDPADAEAARVQAEAIEDLKTNDPEVYKAVEAILSTQLKALTEKFEGMIQPIQESNNDSVLDNHFKEIDAVHSDAEKVVESDEFKQWKDNHWDSERMNQIDELGNAKQVIGMLNEFKRDNPPAADPNADALVAKAEAAAKAALEKKSVPNSLSEVSASSQAHHDPNEALMLKTPKDMVTAFSGKGSSSDILESMNKLL